MSALWPVQKAAVQRWKASAALMNRITGVYDGLAPQGAAYPYVTVGEKTEVPRGVFGGQGWESTLTAHVWSAYQGDKEALEIVDLMHAALAEPLVVDGHGAARLKPEFTATLREDNLRHVPVRYRVIAWEA